MRADRPVLGLLVAGLIACGARSEDLLGAETGTVGGGSTDPSCWQNQLPAEVEPLPPLVSAAEACGGDTGAALLEHGPAPSGDFADARAVLVGRWVLCEGTKFFSTTPHAAIEFGANGRWQLLTDSSSGLVPLTPRTEETSGYYHLFATAQLELVTESAGWTMFDLWVRRNNLLVAPPAEAGAIYARVAPLPLNGRDHLPSITAGTCTLLGTWDTAPAGAGTRDSQAALSFDEQGNFVGGPPRANLCAGHTMYGTYQLSPGLFEMTTHIGMGCNWGCSGGWSIAFRADAAAPRSSIPMTTAWVCATT